MSLNKPIVIAVFGLSAREIRILQTICALSKERARIYELTAPGFAEKPDFAVVDGDDPQALAEWQQFRGHHPMLHLVTVGKGPKSDWPGFQIGRPLLATRLLDLFDQINLTVSHEQPAFAAVVAKEVHSVATPTPAHKEKSGEAQTVSTHTLNNTQLTALVVDDSLPIRRQMQIQLEPFVGRVDLAEDGEQAMECLASHVYSIIFLDVVLPGMDGYKICKAIKRDKHAKETPVIMLTSKSSPFDRVKGKLAGCDTYLTKPVDLLTFEKVLRQYLPKHE
jgi:two-component system, cell cycle response regulator